MITENQKKGSPSSEKKISIDFYGISEAELISVSGLLGPTISHKRAE